MRKAILIASLFLPILLSNLAGAQQMDFAFGLSTLRGTASADATGTHAFQTIGGGAYPAFSADFLFKNRFGVQGEVAWRAGQNLYQGYQPFRPVLFDFNGIWIPKLGDRMEAELMAGGGVQSARFYQNYVTCGSFSGCTNYISSNHLMGHVGGGVRLYFTRNLFIRPEAHLYFVRNNVEFSGANASRVGVSIGYSWRSGN